MIQITRDVTKTCPFVGETDHGQLRIIVHDGDAPELHALGQDIDRICENAISHEEFTRSVADLVPGTAVTVISRWQTGPWYVEVVVSRPVLR